MNRARSPRIKGYCGGRARLSAAESIAIQVLGGHVCRPTPSARAIDARIARALSGKATAADMVALEQDLTHCERQTKRARAN